MDAKNDLLLTILSKSDAVFWPVRRWDLPGTPTTFCEMRRQFQLTGVAWTSGASGDRQRKAEQRRLESLARAGDVELFRTKTRTVGVKLSAKTDDRLRRRIGVADYRHSLQFLDWLYALRGDLDGFDYDNGLPWSTEVTLSGIRWGDNANRGYYVLLTEDMFPLLQRGLVLSNCSGQGHCSYGLTTEGWTLAEKRIQTGKAATSFPPAPPKPGNSELNERYGDLRMAEIQRIEQTKPADPRDLGMIPLSVSLPLRRFEIQKT
jgi:hypothetical protein